MTDQDKINKILKLNTLGVNSIFALEKKIGAGVGAISKPLGQTGKIPLGTVKKIQDGIGVRPEWWEAGKGEIFAEKSTYVDIPIENKQDAEEKEEIYRNLVEANTAYRLVPKTILDEEYRIMLKSEIEEKQKMMKELIKSKDDLISQLKDEIRALRSPVKLTHSENAKK